MKKNILLIVLLIFLSPSLLCAYTDRCITNDELSGNTPIFLHLNESLIIPYFMISPSTHDAINDYCKIEQTSYIVSVDPSCALSWSVSPAIRCTVLSSYTPARTVITIHHYQRSPHELFQQPIYPDRLLNTISLAINIVP